MENRMVMDKKIIKTTIQFMEGLILKKKCNYALTINPNDMNLSLDALYIKIRLIERRLKSICLKNKKARKEFFYIAVPENSANDGKHLHLIVTVPRGTDLRFSRHIGKIVKCYLPKSSYQLDEMYSPERWLSYITKNICLSSNYEGYFLNE